MEHFSHDHLLSLVQMQWNQKNENESDDEDEGDDFVMEEQLGGQCNMCKEMIYSFHLCYYQCKECDYMLHKFCAELPRTLENHPFHPEHCLTLSCVRSSNADWTCFLCNLKWNNFFYYGCSICEFDIDIICATMVEQKMDHPSHPHQLRRMPKPMVTSCNACGDEHKGTFYHCAICPCFYIHLHCALLPTKLLIHKHTNNTFTHSHPLSLVYCFPKIEMSAKFNPPCRVCDEFVSVYFWIYKCDKCQYYVHIKCATSKIEPFMSIFLPAGRGKTFKIFEDKDHPKLLHCPFPDESYNLLKHCFYNQKDFIFEEFDGEKLSQYSTHQHPLVLIDRQLNNSISLHDPMRKVQLLCDGCVKPIMAMPFYKCLQDCGFVLHEWCARLPLKVPNHPGHPTHTLVLMLKPNSMFFGVFSCNNCGLPSSGFMYGCTTCDYYIDTNCAFLPEEITHEAHQNHLLSRIKASTNLSKKYCKACLFYLDEGCSGFHCPSCDFYLHTKCAFLLPGLSRHKYDKHPLSLRYHPAENHTSEYFCEICEDQFNPGEWFYHCTTCVQSTHSACMPLILRSDQHLYCKYERSVFEFINVKFGGKLKMEDHPHMLSFVQGIEGDGECINCDGSLGYKVIFKCFECIHVDSSRCPLCGFASETIDHLFILCRVVSPLWRTISSWCKLPFNITSVSDLLSWGSNTGITGGKGERLLAISTTMLWNTWLHRNRITFDGFNGAASHLFSKAREDAFWWIKARLEKRTSLSWESWSSHPF